MVTGTNSIIDLSHHNGNVNLVKAKAAGIAGVIQKATQGTGFKDPTFDTNRRKAADAGLLFGAYHFGTGADGVEQADFFVSTVQPTLGDLLVLDFECNPQGPTMSLEEARAFVTHVQAVNARFPGIYSGHFLKELLGSADEPVLAQCWLWIAQYGPTPVIPHAWSDWTMWQYTDGAMGPEPHTVDGVGACDRDTFHGTARELKQFWTRAAPRRRLRARVCP
jgi:lysozyme